MITVNKRQVDLIDGKLVGEASTMGIPPGVVPDLIAVVDDKNEGYLFLLSCTEMFQGEVTGWRYMTRTGTNLVVIND